MPTERLSDDDKSTINGEMDAIINRAMFNKKFPVKSKDLFEWLVDQMPDSHQKAYRLLRAENKKLVSTSGTWGSKFKIRDANTEYTVQVTAKVPYDYVVVAENDSRNAEVVEWLLWYEDLKIKVDSASSYAATLVWACTSAGQLKRLLPKEVLRFIPTHLLNFDDVERRSRIPRSFKPDSDKMDNLMQMLALGSLSPKERKGLDIELHHKTAFEDEA